MRLSWSRRYRNVLMIVGRRFLKSRLARPRVRGVGDDAFWLIHEGKNGVVKYFNGGGGWGAATAELA